MAFAESVALGHTVAQLFGFVKPYKEEKDGIVAKPVPGRDKSAPLPKFRACRGANSLRPGAAPKMSASNC